MGTVVPFPVRPEEHNGHGDDDPTPPAALAQVIPLRRRPVPVSPVVLVEAVAA